jgi:hypothetical protein
MNQEFESAYDTLELKYSSFELGRDESSAAPYYCQIFGDGRQLIGQGIGMVMSHAINQALADAMHS